MKDWNTTSDVDWMLLHIDAGVTDRKKRLLATGFCRRIGHLITETRCREMIAQAKLLSVFSLGSGDVPEENFALELLKNVEACADDEMDAQDLAEASELAEIVGHYTAEFYYACYDDGWGEFNHNLIGTCEATLAVCEASNTSVDLAKVAAHAAQAVHRARGGTEQQVQSSEEVSAQCDIIRDVLAGTKRKPKLNPAWRTSTVLTLAEGIYQRRDFSAMPVLADALQDAGCDNDAILNHCRGPGPHVRGCWVVDLVLGKE